MVDRALAVFGGSRVLTPAELSAEVAEAVKRWPKHLREEFEERAAIMEHDGGLERHTAERWALRRVLKRIHLTDTQ